MHDQFDVDLEDHDLLGEVELSISLMIAGTAAAEHLSPAEVDELLGVTPVRRERHATTPGRHAARAGERIAQPGPTARAEG